MSADGGLRRRLALQLIPFLDGRERGSAFDGSWMRAAPLDQRVDPGSLFGGGAGSECRNQRHFITPWTGSL